MAAVSHAAFVTSDDDEDKVTAPVVKSKGDYLLKGKLQDIIERIAGLENSDEKNKTRIVALEDANQEKEGEMQRLTMELKEVVESNKDLKQNLEKTLAEYEDLREKFQKLASEAEEMKVDLSNYKTRCDALVQENKKLQEKLEESGVEKIHWWKVVALGLVVGIIGLAIGGGIPLVISGSLVLTGGVVAGASIGGTTGVAIGGAGAYLHEIKACPKEERTE
ncbi:uncharacterized protein LOC144427195 [Styela clava]